MRGTANIADPIPSHPLAFPLNPYCPNPTYYTTTPSHQAYDILQSVITIPLPSLLLYHPHPLLHCVSPSATVQCLGVIQPLDMVVLRSEFLVMGVASTIAWSIELSRVAVVVDVR